MYREGMNIFLYQTSELSGWVDGGSIKDLANVTAHQSRSQGEDVVINFNVSHSVSDPLSIFHPPFHPLKIKVTPSYFEIAMKTCITFSADGENEFKNFQPNRSKKY